MNCTPLAIQYTILSNKWGAVQNLRAVFYFIGGCLSYRFFFLLNSQLISRISSL